MAFAARISAFTPVSYRYPTRSMRVFCLLAAMWVTPTPARAQSANRIADAVAQVVSTLADGAHTAAVAFRGESIAFPMVESDAPSVSSVQRTRRALVAVCGVAIIGFLIALITLVTAQGPLEAVARAAERDISQSFWFGLLSQALATPILIVIALLLALTIILIPAIPIAMLAWALAYAGAFTLGLLAVALVLGRALLRRSTTHNRGALLSSLMLGLTVLVIVWFAAALLVSVPTVGVVMRVVALALSWVAATVGLGAVVRSRAGTLREHMETTTTEAAVPAWQTPTPVFGVVAARRPTPASSTVVE